MHYSYLQVSRNHIARTTIVNVHRYHVSLSYAYTETAFVLDDGILQTKFN